MPTPLYAEYVTLGGLMLGSRAIECFNWDDLRGSAKRHPGNFVSQGVAGTTARQPVEGELEALLEIRVNGRYDQDNAPVSTSYMANFYSLRATLFAKLETNTTQTITLTHEGSTSPDSADCQIVSDVRVKPTSAPWIREFAVTVLLPDGALL